MESHKEGVLDIFQEHVAFCHDVVLLSRSRQSTKDSGKDPAQPALRLTDAFKAGGSWEPTRVISSPKKRTTPSYVT